MLGSFGSSAATNKDVTVKHLTASHKNDVQSVSDSDSRRVKIGHTGLIFVETEVKVDGVGYCDCLLPQQFASWWCSPISTRRLSLSLYQTLFSP